MITENVLTQSICSWEVIRTMLRTVLKKIEDSGSLVRKVLITNLLGKWLMKSENLGKKGGQ